MPMPPSLLSLAILLLLGVSRSAAYDEAPTIVPRDEMSAILTDMESKTTKTTTAALSFIENCKRSGFDPLQLACTTCAILPKQHRGRCESCCQSYKTLEKRSKRYETAILVNTGHPESVGELLRDDKDGILERKGSSRFLVRDVGAEMDAMRMMGMFQREPSVILWFDGDDDYSNGGGDFDPEAATVSELAAKADETTFLTGRGLGRDDIRDMLLALLPDKE